MEKEPHTTSRVADIPDHALDFEMQLAIDTAKRILKRCGYNSMAESAIVARALLLATEK